MRRAGFMTFVFIIVVPAAAPALACGDKFLLVGRGARYQRGFVSLHPGTLLLLANTPATTPRGLRAALKLAGHHLTVASSLAEIEPALKKAKYDVVLADSSETAAVERDVVSIANPPIVIPVIAAKAAAPEKSGSGKEFCVLRTGNRQRHPLAILDDVLGSKQKGTPPPCEPSR
jgi:hypothetical protein